MKITRKRERGAEVYTASLNDIMFFLLLFFLIISTMITPAAIRVSLPSSKTSNDVLVRKNINLVITEDKRYYIENREITFDQVEPELASALSALDEGEDINVLLQADKSLNLQDVIDVIDIANKLKLKMILFTQKDK